MLTTGLVLLALAGHESDLHRPVPSPDGSRIAFTLECGDFHEAMVMSLADGSLRRVTNNTENDWYPHWSPDGKSLVFFRGSELAGHRRYRLIQNNLDGGSEQVIFDSGFYDGDAEYSPDGNLIAFNSNFEGDHNVYIANRDGTEARRISPGNDSDFSPSFHPDGESLVYVSQREDKRHRLVTSSIDGSSQETLAVGRTENFKPHFSPDGKRLVFFGPLGDSDEKQYDIFSYHFADRTLRRLTSDPAFDGDPKWMPDGQHIVFASTRGRQASFWIMRVDGSEKKPLFSNSTHNAIEGFCNSQAAASEESS